MSPAMYIRRWQRTTGYEPNLRIEDDEISDGGPLPGRTPAQRDDTPDT